VVDSVLRIGVMTNSVVESDNADCSDRECLGLGLAWMDGWIGFPLAGAIQVR
jgi:hypothetical protein